MKQTSYPVQQPETKDNYAKQVEIARTLFLTYDQEEILAKLPVEADEKYLFLPMLDQMYRISRTAGTLEAIPFSSWEKSSEEWQCCETFETVLTVYDILCYSKAGAVNSGEWRTLEGFFPAGSPSGESLFQTYAEWFDGKTEELNHACEALGGKRQSVPASADACYQMNLFPFVPVLFEFWEGDEEFAPRLQVLWDRNALEFLHYETLYYAVHHLLNRMKETMSA